ncbi:MAG: sensor histidine kinase [Syntrophothermus sp.]|uniref:histidine kinase n=1 Tax=Pelotomaculum thermopropionicum (strain DSM 13744 / JCM 10971 / SI) TaxID=370438 RepID=A5D2L2_PELTS|nr:sensor histidine kinase [Syntrophothermus sp.]NSW82494.1 sensor histidine kinase [Syntrophothermus sp.]BAF59530.1 signal transduction histidine kinase [Pelotomaculum thermopropionicum SI]
MQKASLLTKNNKKKFLTLRTKMAILSFGSVFLSILIGGLIVVGKISVTLEKELGMRAMAIARTLAQFEEIQKNVGRPGGEVFIQPLAERTRLATGVEYIVIVDMEGRRYSHPVEDRIGKKFNDPDLGPALANNEYISSAEGVLGPSVRAFVPIKVDEGTRQVGVVIVGILTPTIGSILRTIQIQLYYSLGIGLAVGLLGSLYLARKIKSAMFSLEPEEIARLLEEREAAFQAMSEGIIAIDTEGRITIANNEAGRIIGKNREEIVGRHIKEVIPNTRLPEVLHTGIAHINTEMFLNDTMVLVRRVPIRFKGEIIGAVSTFQDKTEVNKLAEELTGVKAFVEALRVQNHEHMNKLHTIAGLIQLGKYQHALDYIFNLTEEQQELTRLLSKNIFDHSIAGLILGKYNRAKELRVEMEIDRNTFLKELPPSLETGGLVIIIGNLIENALDAVRRQQPDRRRVYFGLFDKPGSLEMIVRDSGPGIPEDARDKIFDQGFTTKGAANRGLGLYLVKRYVDLAQGSISLKCPDGGGTEFNIRIPKASNNYKES